MLILLLSIIIMPSEVWAQKVIFSAVPKDRNESLSAPKNSETLVDNANATIEGGSLYIRNTNANFAQKYILSDQGPTGKKRTAFTIVMSPVSFKIVLNTPLAVGDTIKASMFDDGDICFTTSSTKPNSLQNTKLEGQKNNKWNDLTYIVRDNDGICGASTIYAYGFTQNPVFSYLKITRKSIPGPAFFLNTDESTLYPATANTVEVTQGTDIKLKATSGTIYYTLDGSTPSAANGIEYSSGGFRIIKDVTAKAIAVDNGVESDVTVMNFTLPARQAENNDLWEADDATASSGTLAVGNRIISMGNNSSEAVKYITVSFGGGNSTILGNEAWGETSFHGNSQGPAIDGVGKYSISVGNDAADETGTAYSHANATGGTVTSVLERSFKLPAQGAFVRFEPERDGVLTIWAVQEGALDYSNQGVFNPSAVSRRPVYMVDEQGTSCMATEAVSSARLDANWSSLSNPASSAVYTMLQKIQSDNSFTVGNQIHPKAIHTSAVYNTTGVGTNGVGDNIIDNTGYVMLSSGNVRYKFNLEAGKTYYFFGSGTRIGIRGFRFEPENADKTAITMKDDGKYSDETSISITANDKNNVTIVRTTGPNSSPDNTYAFKADTWAALVLPFSVSESKVLEVFGADTKIIYFTGIGPIGTGAPTTINFKQHYYRMILAGVPVIIKPSQNVTTAQFGNVKMEAASVTPITAGTYSLTGSYTPATVPNYSFYVTSDGTLKQLDNNAGVTSRGFRAWIAGATEVLDAPVFRLSDYDGSWLDDDDIPTSVISIHNDSNTDGPVYSLQGQLIRSGSNIDNLPKGIYIINGKKKIVR
ncbi:MAG: chitobiase/beta-hexosaminidase C-terminal domain-containing protein [Prevotella sp.]|nr:chitobiase/beta-hexosaminidase C-terminal domain-containing protein [Prevotella sp.]